MFFNLTFYNMSKNSSKPFFFNWLHYEDLKDWLLKDVDKENLNVSNLVIIQQLHYQTWVSEH